MALAQEANRYLEVTSPWKTISLDREAAATALFVAVGVISCLKTLLYPFLPLSSQRLHALLGFPGEVSAAGWQWHRPLPGQVLPPPQPLFRKLEDEVAAREMAKLGQA